jgi:hypothetical protein
MATSHLRSLLWPQLNAGIVMQSSDSGSNSDAEPRVGRKGLPTAVIAAILATIMAAIPLAIGLEGSLSERRDCYGGLCSLNALYYVAASIVWLGSWPIFCLIVWGIRKADASVVGRGPPDAA